MTPKERIDELIAGLTDWRGKVLAAVRKTFNDAHPDILEEWKWMGSPTWSKDGLIGVVNPHQGKVKITFAYGAAFPDPHRLFNTGFEGNARRGIDIFEGDKLDLKHLKELVRSAITFNESRRKKQKPAAKKAPVKKKPAAKKKVAKKKAVARR